MFLRWPSKFQTPNLHRASASLFFFLPSCFIFFLPFSAFCLSCSVFSFFSSFLLFIFPLSPSALSASFHLSPLLRSFFFSFFFFSSVPSAYSKSWTNKQAAGGSRLLSIIQASQTTARMFAKHMKCIFQHRTRRERGKKNLCFTITVWTPLTENIAGRFQIMFMAFLLRVERKHNVEMVTGRILWDQHWV